MSNFNVNELYLQGLSRSEIKNNFQSIRESLNITNNNNDSIEIFELDENIEHGALAKSNTIRDIIAIEFKEIREALRIESS